MNKNIGRFSDQINVPIVRLANKNVKSAFLKNAIWCNLKNMLVLECISFRTIKEELNQIIGRLGPKVMISIFLVSSLEIAFTSGKWNLGATFHNFWHLRSCRSTQRMIYSITNYNVIRRGNFLSFLALHWTLHFRGAK